MMQILFKVKNQTLTTHFKVKFIIYEVQFILNGMKSWNNLNKELGEKKSEYKIVKKIYKGIIFLKHNGDSFRYLAVSEFANIFISCLFSFLSFFFAKFLIYALHVNVMQNY